MDELFYHHLVAKRLSQSSRQPGSDRHFWRQKLSVPKSLMFSLMSIAHIETEVRPESRHVVVVVESVQVIPECVAKGSRL